MANQLRCEVRAALPLRAKAGEHFSDRHETPGDVLRAADRRRTCPSSPYSSLSSWVCGVKKGSTWTLSQWLISSCADAAPDDLLRSSDARPNEAATGRYALTTKRSVPSRMSSESTRARRRLSTAYVPDKWSADVVTSHRYIACGTGARTCRRGGWRRSYGRVEVWEPGRGWRRRQQRREASTHALCLI